jgi:hypothetical protein
VSSRNLAVIMDPIESIKPHKDSSLAMLLEAQCRGWQIHYGQLNDIWLRDGQDFGRLTRLNVDRLPANVRQHDACQRAGRGQQNQILRRGCGVHQNGGKLSWCIGQRVAANANASQLSDIFLFFACRFE